MPLLFAFVAHSHAADGEEIAAESAVQVHALVVLGVHRLRVSATLMRPSVLRAGSSICAAEVEHAAERAAGQTVA